MSAGLGSPPSPIAGSSPHASASAAAPGGGGGGGGGSGGGAVARLDKLRSLHASIIGGVQQVQQQTATILAEQEKDLLRAFRARLGVVQADLEAQRERADSGVAEYVKRCNALERQLEATRAEADRSERLGAALAKENARLKAACRRMEEDRELIVKQVVEGRRVNAAAESEAAAARRQLEALQAELEDEREQQQLDRMRRLESAESAEKSRRAGGGGGGGGGGGAGSEAFAPPLTDEDARALASGIALGTEPLAAGGQRNATLSGLTVMDEARYRDVIARLKRMLDAERRAARLARLALVADTQARTHAEVFLREAIDEARADVAKKRAELERAAAAGDRAAQRQVRDQRGGAAAREPTLTREHRESILSGLLAQDNVLASLAAVAFPSREGGGVFGVAQAAALAAASPEKEKGGKGGGAGSA
jgi:hypothetical protein